MAVKTRAVIKSEMDAVLLNTAPEKSITPEVMKGFLVDIADSFLNTPTDTNLQGLRPYDATLVYTSGSIVQYDYSWYKANTTTVAGAFDSSKWDFQGYIEYTKEITIETAQVLTLHSVPVLAIAAVTSRTLRIRNIRASITYNSTTYAVNTTIEIYTDTATMFQFQIINFLAATLTRSIIGRANTVTPGASDTQFISGKGIYIDVATGDPTTGNSQIKIKIDYIVE